MHFDFSKSTNNADILCCDFVINGAGGVWFLSKFILHSCSILKKSIIPLKSHYICKCIYMLYIDNYSC